MEQGGVGAELGLDSEEFVFRGGTHPNMVLAGLDVLYRENTFTHVKDQGGGGRVLSSFSPYFVLKHFQETIEGEIKKLYKIGCVT